MENIYKFKSYKELLKAYIASSPLRGVQTKLAQAAGCQTAYLSKVLQRGSKVQLTPDHIFGICEYMQLSSDETKYMHLLLEKERASQVRYKKKLEAEISETQEQILRLKKQLDNKTISTNTIVHEIYYSHWLYSALHIAVSIPSLQSISALSKYLGVSKKKINRCLEWLESQGFVQSKSSGVWVWKKGNIHLADDSPFIPVHHSNWRVRALQDFNQENQSSLHYSVVQSISRKDYEQLKFMMVEWIKMFQKVSSPSDPEELVNFNLDFYVVKSESE